MIMEANKIYNEGIVVVSCFDGMACAYIALKKLGIKVKKYYAYEVDKHAIKVAKANFPDIIHLGDITKGSKNDFGNFKVDLFCGGSPCQGFSFAGKQLNFSDPRSALFFEFVRLWKEIKSVNPDAKFLLENVNMKREYLRVISEYMGVFPVNINSKLLSAQNRQRWYWSNIKTKDVGLFSELWTDIPQPEDKGILLKDILEREVDEKYFLSDKMLKYILNEASKKTNRTRLTYPEQEKCGTILANEYKQGTDSNFIITHSLQPRGHVPMIRDNKVNQIKPSTESGGKQTYQQNRVYADYGKMTALDTRSNQKSVFTKNNIRRLTPTECKRLQTVPDWFDMTMLSDTQKYKTLGNGWTVDVIAHIFSFMDFF